MIMLNRPSANERSGDRLHQVYNGQHWQREMHRRRLRALAVDGPEQVISVRRRLIESDRLPSDADTHGRGTGRQPRTAVSQRSSLGVPKYDCSL